MPLGLHIFEERYRAMMRDCQEAGSSFGIAAIREGFEVGGGAEPYEVGTLAQLLEVKPLDDGGYDLVVSGASRFRIEDVSRQRPYPVAAVRYLQDVSGSPQELARLTPLVTRTFVAYVEGLRRWSSEAVPDLDLPEDPELLSYIVAAALEADTPSKQQLLEVDSAAERLRRCLKLLRREIAFLERGLVHRESRLVSIAAN
jgi:Lon protease-like protein